MSSAEELDLIRSTVARLMESGPVELPTMADLGLLGLLVPEAVGGSGWCVVEATAVADQIGRAAALAGSDTPDVAGSAAPWLVASLGAAALGVCGDPRGLLGTALDGSGPVVMAAGNLSVTADGGSGALVGVELPAEAPAVVVVGADGRLDLLDIDATGVEIRPDPTSIDTTRSLKRIDLSDAPIVPLGSSVAVRNASWVLSASTMVGSLRAALARLLPYLSDRIAFGSPIASFQAVQHRLVDLTLLEIRAGVAVDAAARALAADPEGSTALAAAAHALAAEHVPTALDDCVQLTGGIGFTWEYPLHHELRRSVSDGTTFGSARSSREALLAVTQWA
jgi:hypothetical protein